MERIDEDQHPGAEKKGAETPGGEPQEPVEDRPNVWTVRPEDYPPDDRTRS